MKPDTACGGSLSRVVMVATYLISVVLTSARPVLAETSAAPAEAALDEIVVTAQRRSENLQQVPISVVARTGEELVNAGIYNSSNLQNISPSLSIQPSTTGSTFVNIRGVGLQQTNPASSNGVAFYLDGVYDPNFQNEVDAFYDIRDVEVLRGPQGTLVGSNADGGAIFINSVKPSLNGGFTGYVMQQFANFGDYRTEGAINLPISDMWPARLAVVHESRDVTQPMSVPNRPRALSPALITSPVTWTTVRLAFGCYFSPAITPVCWHVSSNLTPATMDRR